MDHISLLKIKNSNKVKNTQVHTVYKSHTKNKSKDRADKSKQRESRNRNINNITQGKKKKKCSTKRKKELSKIRVSKLWPMGQI